MKRIHVVTSFLLRRDGPSDRVLLLRRSERVRTYRGLWAGVSGYVEGEPDEQATVEIREETGLGRADIRMLKRGEAVEAEDTSNDCVWVIHPYLFLVKKPEKVRLDWEHSAGRWIEPKALRRYLTVPKLKEALQRVYPPPFSPRLERALREIREDAEHGAGQLARQAARALAGARPSMAPLGNIAALVLDEVQEAVDAGASDVKALAVEAADGWRRRSEEAAERIAVEAAPLLHGVIVTSSYSSTVLRALGRNRARLERVFVGEGRPRLEGRATARELAQAGTPVVLVTDALASHSVVEADAVVVGADAVTASGAVVNKAGTYALALAARDRKVPFYVLADTLKLWPRREPPPLESRPGAELWPEAAPGVEVSNVTFDITPGRLVAGYVTEEGCMDRRRIASRAKVLAQARRRVGL